MITLSFHRGTLFLDGSLQTSSHFGLWDDRVQKGELKLFGIETCCSIA